MMMANLDDDNRNSDTGDDTSTDSSTENNDQEETGAPTGTDDQGNDSNDSGSDDNKEDEFKDLPFHEHPRWKQRETEWNERFETQEQKIEKRITDAVQAAMSANKPQAPSDATEKIANGPIPKWFGGGQDTPEVRAMWKEYIAEQTQIISDAEKRAEERALERVNQQGSTQEKLVADANKFFDDSVNKIEAETKKRVDRNKLLKYTLDNEIVDHKTQRWDYAKAYRWMVAEEAAKSGNQGGDNKQGSRQDRKNLAGASVRDSGKGGGGQGSNVTTSDDFKKPQNRPW